jgi:hypothetical protein
MGGILSISLRMQGQPNKNKRAKCNTTLRFGRGIIVAAVEHVFWTS